MGIRARVVAYRKMATEGEPYLSEECSTTTNADGQFSCATLPIGSYIIEETPLNNVDCSACCALKDDTLFYPGVPDLIDAESIPVTAQEAPWIEIQERASQTTFISGILTPGLSHVAFDLSTIGRGVELHLDREVQFRSSTGNFKVSGLMPGRYDLRATWMLDHFKHVAFAIVSLGENPITNLHLTTVERANVSGSITAPDQITISMIELRPLGIGGAPIQVPVKNGRFHINNLETGKYEIEVLGRGNTYINSLRWDGYPVTGNPYFQVMLGGTHVLNIGLTGPGGEVIGNLALSPFIKSTGSADVIAVSEGTNIVYHCLTNNSEQFSFYGLPPGFYRFYAWSRPNQAPFRITSFREQYRGESQELFVDAGALESVSDLDVINQTF